MKKILSVVLALVMLFSLSIPAFADTVTSTETGSNSKSKNVTASYTPSSSTEEKAVITSVSIEVKDKDGKTVSPTGTLYTIKKDYTVTYTVIGTNLDKGSGQVYVKYERTTTSDINKFTWTINSNGTIATREILASNFTGTTTAFEVEYSNDKQATWTKAGFSIIYVDDTTEEKATITGLSIAVVDENGATVTAVDGVYTIKSDYKVTFTVTGTNLDKATNDNVVWCYKSGAVYVNTAAGWTFTADKGTITLDGSRFSTTTEEYEIKYTNEGDVEGATWVPTGIKVIYGGESEIPNKPVITGVVVKMGDKTYASGETLTLTSTSGVVTFIVKGENLNNINDNKHMIRIGSFTDTVKTTTWTINATGTEATKDIDIKTKEDIKNVTAAQEVKYTNDGMSVITGTGIYILYQADTISVDITWGAMSFTYSDEKVDGTEKGWSCEDGANKITVTNNSSSVIGAVASYTAETAYSGITGSFVDSNGEAIESGAGQLSTSVTNKSMDFYLVLAGKPSAAITAGTKIGQVTITIGIASIS